MLIIFFFVFYFFLCLWRPKLALFLLCVLLSSYQIRFKVFGLPTTLLEVMIVLLFTCWLIKKIKSGNWSLRIGGWKFIFLAWLIVGLIAVFVSPNKWLALGHWRAYFLEPILLILVLVDFARSDLNLRSEVKDFKQISNKRFGFWLFEFILNLEFRIANLFKRLFLKHLPWHMATFSSIITLVLCGLGFSALFCSIWAIFQKFFGGGVLSTEVWGAPQVWRATGPFPQPNFLGLYLGPIVMLALAQLVSNLKFQNSKLNLKCQIWNFKDFWVVCFWALVAITGLIAIIFARSEGAILGLLAGLIFYFLTLLRKKQKLVFVIILFSIFCLLLSVNSWRYYIVEKIGFKDLSGQLRLNIWRGTIELIKDRPIFGAGLRGYQVLIKNYQKPFYSPETGQLISVETHPYPHNLFLAIWAELGFFGLIVFLIILFQFFKSGFQKLFRNRKLEIENLERAKSEEILIGVILSAMITILVHGLVDTPYFKNDLSILFWLFVGLLIVIHSQRLDEKIKLL